MIPAILIYYRPRRRYRVAWDRLAIVAGLAVFWAALAVAVFA